MSTIANAKTTIPNGLDARVMTRVIEEGYGPEAWHGAGSEGCARRRPARARLLAAGAGTSQHRRDCAAPRLLRARSAGPALGHGA
jgi:hypothetical protein